MIDHDGGKFKPACDYGADEKWRFVAIGGNPEISLKFRSTEKLKKPVYDAWKFGIIGTIDFTPWWVCALPGWPSKWF